MNMNRIILGLLIAVIGREGSNSFLSAMGRSIRPPWQAKHKLAAAGPVTT
jgi:hypothetical protein